MERDCGVGRWGRYRTHLLSPPRSHGRIRYPPSSQSGLFGQDRCAFLIAAASGERYCGPVITAPYRGLWWVLCDRAIDTELPKVISAINTRMVSFMAGIIAPTKRGIFTRTCCQEGVACGGLGRPLEQADWQKVEGWCVERRRSSIPPDPLSLLHLVAPCTTAGTYLSANCSPCVSGVPDASGRPLANITICRGVFRARLIWIAALLFRRRFQELMGRAQHGCI